MPLHGKGAFLGIGRTHRQARKSICQPALRRGLFYEAAENLDTPYTRRSAIRKIFLLHEPVTMLFHYDRRQRLGYLLNYFSYEITSIFRVFVTNIGTIS